ncbi:DUF3139 domain-containing protein [Staphylococcus sp. SQ8-PEA]|uniref:DUF3139 domain-containing protein n=1 Tax=Staphylococcus marylandisciuri TaxID=2981529 RepID=A0ABT2QT11_9STAP|nr:DUF3139 domain-containing protein [Staphylococcus marylandisciuri]MCU5747131.1 DUF3139 domain-containing protein [Staphylococcus marylandisciuri]
MKKFFKVTGIIIIILIIALVLIFNIGKYIYLGYQKHEEDKTKAKVHHELKKRGWENKIKTEEGVFTLNTGNNYTEVTFKDDPYNNYHYDFEENGRITGDAILKDKYDEKPKDYKKPYEIK